MLKVAIIGCGAIAPAHIEGYLRFPEQVEITALVNRGRDRADELIGRYGLSAVWMEDYRKALAQADIVSICTPPGLHARMAVDALRAGCHTLLEKPMAPTLAECDEMLRAARESGALLSVVAQSRFISDTRNVIDLVRGREYGRCLYARVNSLWYRGQSYYYLDWRGRWESEGGGCTLNHSIHQIDLLNWAKGMPVTVQAAFANLCHDNSEEEDFSSSLLRYGDGSVAEITSTLAAHGEGQQLVFQMERAGVEIPFRAHASKPRENGFPLPDEETRARVEQDFFARPQLQEQHHAGQIANLLDAIAGKAPLVSSGQDGRNSIEVITAIYQSAVTGQTAALPIPRDSVWYTGEWRKHAPHFHEKTKEVGGFADRTITLLNGKG